MMECNVVRDLMPLVQDDVASAESKRAVQEHIAGCSACAEYLKAMQATLETAAAQQEQERQVFDKAARQLRAKRQRRMWRNVLIGMIVGVLILLGGAWAWTRLTQDYVVTMDCAEYGVSLAQTKSGEVAVNIDYRGSAMASGICLKESAPDEKGQVILYISNTRAVIPQYIEFGQRNYCCEFISPDMMRDYYAEIRSGTPDVYEVIWKQGDAIPAASEELEEYRALVKEYGELWQEQAEIDDGKAADSAPEVQKRQTEINNQMADLEWKIPEWQTKWD